MGASASTLNDVTQEELIKQCTEVYATDPLKWEFILAEAKKKAVETKKEVFSSEGNETVEVVRCSTEMCEMINRVRIDPPAFVFELEKHLELFIDEFVYRDVTGGQGVNIRTVEGKAAVREAIIFLKNSAPLEALNPNQFLESAAVDHCLDLYNNGLTTHDGSNGCTIAERIEKYAAWSGSIAESINFNQVYPLKTLLTLIIDDGFPSRGNRKNVFSDKFKLVGAASGPHKVYKQVCVMDFASDVKDFNTIVNTDCKVEAVGQMSDEFRKVVNSIPVDTLLSDMEKELSEKATVEINFSFTTKTAEIKIKKDATTLTRRLRWGSA
mmetsp:Transcript_35141/g.35779  ORF Transcript_35141/g.35779 Transcript_35141/m.35779 type:complete len:325 (+) Transcript_35141:257-1231(+)|eukprot:CAMPEP_0182427958 /NCGR_PEP_ID=MMETSP1167-20130531/20917_1 /TAXON_ID=2988 /ORGANISM="Mallomonas Sp, Strain CCMP3275" /LENGTH=324 /DNA_ID=CAMNT_0024610569 /DNA_START=254 /DNA_END=1228 /DNA_ORIENTATION=+